MAHIQISEFNDSYKDKVILLILQIQQDEFNVPVTIKDQPELNNIPGTYQLDGGNFWVATAGDDVIGTIGLIDAGRNIGALRKMFVDKRYRGKQFGIGQMLLNRLMDHARDNHINEIFLGTTADFKAAHRFYEKNGFTAVTKGELPENFPAMNVDHVFYRLALRK